MGGHNCPSAGFRVAIDHGAKTAGGGLVRSRTKGKSSAALTGVDGGAAQEGEASEAEEEEGSDAEVEKVAGARVVVRG